MAHALQVGAPRAGWARHVNWHLATAARGIVWSAPRIPKQQPEPNEIHGYCETYSQLEGQNALHVAAAVYCLVTSVLLLSLHRHSITAQQAACLLHNICWALNLAHPACEPCCRCSTHLSVAPRHPRDELLEEVAGFILAEPVGLDDTIEQLAARGILHGDAKVGAGQEDLPMGKGSTAGAAAVEEPKSSTRGTKTRVLPLEGMPHCSFSTLQLGAGQAARAVQRT